MRWGLYRPTITTHLHTHVYAFTHSHGSKHTPPHPAGTQPMCTMGHPRVKRGADGIHPYGQSLLVPTPTGAHAPFLEADTHRVTLIHSRGSPSSTHLLPPPPQKPPRPCGRQGMGWGRGGGHPAYIGRTRFPAGKGPRETGTHPAWSARQGDKQRHAGGTCGGPSWGPSLTPAARPASSSSSSGGSSSPRAPGA